MIARSETYSVKGGQLDEIDHALNVLTMAYHACLQNEEAVKGIDVGVIGSGILLASLTISDIVDSIRGGGRTA